MQRSEFRSSACAGSVLVLLGLAAAPAAATPAQDSFPESAVEAMHAYEVAWPLKDWNNGPVQYLMLKYEVDTWKKLRTDEERREFVDWFWNRRDPDPRDDNSPLRTEFYTRVAYANQRFNGFPKGWRSDRGRVYIILGPPTGGTRRTDGGGGRCVGTQGELWTFNTMGMAFSASMGEFYVLFIETRVNTYEVCDPVMLGPGAYPPELSRALDVTREAWVFDNVTEFEPGRGVVAAEERATDVVARTETMNVPDWPDLGAAGQIVVPIEIPLRELFFEPIEDRLVATLRASVTLTAVGAGGDQRGSRDWELSLDETTARAIGGSALRTAIVLPAAPGGWSVSVRIVDPLSSVAYTWDQSLEVSADGAAASPPLVSTRVERLREGGEVAVLAPSPSRVAAGAEMAVVSWVRGVVPAAEEIGVSLIAADGTVIPLQTAGVAWGSADSAGPLLVQTTAAAPAGTYLLRLTIGALAPAETVIRIE